MSEIVFVPNNLLPKYQISNNMKIFLLSCCFVVCGICLIGLYISGEGGLSELKLPFLSMDNSSESKSSISKVTLYHHPGCYHCQQFKGEWLKFESWGNANGFNVTNVDCKEHECPSNIRGYPTVLMKKKNGQIEEYDGSRTANGLIEHVTTN